MSFIDWLGEQKDNLLGTTPAPPPVEEPPAPQEEYVLTGGGSNTSDYSGAPVAQDASEVSPPADSGGASDAGYASEPVGGNDVVYTTDSPDPAAGAYRIQDPAQSSPPVQAETAPAPAETAPASATETPPAGSSSQPTQNTTDTPEMQSEWATPGAQQLVDQGAVDPMQAPIVGGVAQKAADYMEYTGDVAQGGQDRKALQEKAAAGGNLTDHEKAALATGAPLPGAEQEAAAARGNVADAASGVIDELNDARYRGGSAVNVPNTPLPSAAIIGINPGDYQSQLTRPVGETFEEEQNAVRLQATADVQFGGSDIPGPDDGKSIEQLTQERRIARYDDAQEKAARDSAIRAAIYQPQTGVDPNTGQEFTFFAPVVDPQTYEMMAFVEGARYDAELAGVDLDVVTEDPAIQEEWQRQAELGIYRDAPFLALINSRMVLGLTEDQAKATLGLIQASALVGYAEGTFKTLDWNPGGWEGAVGEKLEGAAGIWGAPQNAYNSVQATRLYETLTGKEGQYSFDLKDEAFALLGTPLGQIDTANMTAFYSRDLDGDGKIDAVASGSMQKIFEDGFTDPISGEHYPGYNESGRAEDGGMALYQAYMAEQNTWTRIVSQLTTDPTVEAELLAGIASGGLSTVASVAERRGLSGLGLMAIKSGAHLMEASAAASDPLELLGYLGRTPKGLRGLLHTAPSGTVSLADSSVGQSVIEILRQREPGMPPRQRTAPAPSGPGGPVIASPGGPVPAGPGGGSVPAPGTTRDPGTVSPPGSQENMPNSSDTDPGEAPQVVHQAGGLPESRGKGPSGDQVGPGGASLSTEGRQASGLASSSPVEGPVTGEASRLDTLPPAPDSLPMPDPLPPDLVVETPKPVRVVQDGVSTPAQLPEEPAWLRDDFGSGESPGEPGSPNLDLVGAAEAGGSPARTSGRLAPETPVSSKPASPVDVSTEPRLVETPVHIRQGSDDPVPHESSADVQALERQASDQEAKAASQRRRNATTEQRQIDAARSRGESVRRSEVDAPAESVVNPDSRAWRPDVDDSLPSLRKGLVVYQTPDAVDVLANRVGHLVGHEENALFVTSRNIGGTTYHEVYRRTDLSRPIARFRNEAHGSDPVGRSFGVANHVGNYGQAVRYAQDVIFRESGSGTAYLPFKRVVNGSTIPSYQGGQGWYIMDGQGVVRQMPTRSDVQAMSRYTNLVATMQPETFDSQLGRAMVKYLEDAGVVQKWPMPGQNEKMFLKDQQVRLDNWQNLMTERAHQWPQQTIDYIEADILDIEQSANRWRRDYALDAEGNNARKAKFNQARQFGEQARARQKQLLEHMAQMGITAPSVSGRLKLPNGDYAYRSGVEAKAHFREVFGDQVEWTDFFDGASFGSPAYIDTYQSQVIGRLIPLVEQYPVSQMGLKHVIFYDGSDLDRVDEMLHVFDTPNSDDRLAYPGAGGRHYNGRLYFNLRPGGQFVGGKFVPPTWDRLERLTSYGMSSGPTHGHGSDLQVITSHEFAHLLDDTLESLDSTLAWKSWKISRGYDNGLVGTGRQDLDYLDDYLKSSGAESLAGVFQTGYLGRGVLTLPEFEELDRSIKQISDVINTPRDVPIHPDDALQFQQLAQTTHFPLGDATKKLLINENPETPRLPEDFSQVVTPEVIADADLPYTPDEVDRQSLLGNPEVRAEAEWEIVANPGAFVPVGKTSQGIPIAVGMRGPLPTQGITELGDEIESQLLAPRQVEGLFVDHDGVVMDKNGNRITPTKINGKEYYPRQPEAFDEAAVFVVKPGHRGQGNFHQTVKGQLLALNVKKIVISDDMDEPLRKELGQILQDPELRHIEIVREKAYQRGAEPAGPFARIRNKLQTQPGFRGGALILGSKQADLDMLKQGITVNVPQGRLTKVQARELITTPDASGYTPMDRMNAYITAQLDKAGRLEQAVKEMDEGGVIHRWEGDSGTYPSIDFSGFEKVMQAWADGDVDIVNWLDDPQYDIEHLTMQKWQKGRGDRPSVMPQYVEMGNYSDRGLLSEDDVVRRESEIFGGPATPEGVRGIAPFVRGDAVTWQDMIADRFGSGRPLEAPSRFDTRGDAIGAMMRQQYELRGNEDLARSELPVQQDRLSKMGHRQFKKRKEQIKATVVEQADPIPGVPLKGATSDEVTWKSGDIIASGTYQEAGKETFWSPEDGVNVGYLTQQWAREELPPDRAVPDWEVRIPGVERGNISSGYAQHVSRGEQVTGDRPPLRYSVKKLKYQDGRFRDYITLTDNTGRVHYSGWGEFAAEHNPEYKYKQLGESLGVRVNYPEELLISSDELAREAGVVSRSREEVGIPATVRRYEDQFVRSTEGDASGAARMTVRVGDYDVSQAADGSFTGINWKTLDAIDMADILSGYQPRSLMDRDLVEMLGKLTTIQNRLPSYREVLQQRFDGLFGGDRALVDDASVQLSQMIPHGRSKSPGLPPDVRISEDGHAFQVVPPRGKSGQALLQKERKPATLGNESAAYQDAHRYEDTTSPEYRSKDSRQQYSPHQTLDPTKDVEPFEKYVEEGDEPDSVVQAREGGVPEGEIAFQGHPTLQMMNYTAEFDGQFIRIRQDSRTVAYYPFRGVVSKEERSGLQSWMNDALAELDRLMKEAGWPVARKEIQAIDTQGVARRLRTVGEQLTEPPIPASVSGLDPNVGSLARPIAGLKESTLPQVGGFGSDARLSEVLRDLDPQMTPEESNGVLLAQKIRDWGKRNIPFGQSRDSVEWKVALLDQTVNSGTARFWERIYLTEDVVPPAKKSTVYRKATPPADAKIVRDHSYIVGSSGRGTARQVAVLLPPGTHRGHIGRNVVLPRGSRLIDLGTVEGVKTYQVLTPDGLHYLPGPAAQMPAPGLPKAPLASQRSSPIVAPWTRGDFSGLPASAALPGGFVAADGSHLLAIGDGSIVHIPADLLAELPLSSLPSTSGLSEAAQSYLVSMGTPPIISAYRWPDMRVGYVAFGQDLETLGKLSEDWALSPQVLTEETVEWTLWGRRRGESTPISFGAAGEILPDSLRRTLPSSSRFDLPSHIRQPYSVHTSAIQSEIGLDHPLLMRPTSDGQVLSVPWVSSARDWAEHRGDKVVVGFLEKSLTKHAADWPFLKRIATEEGFAGDMNWVGAATLRGVHQDYTEDVREMWADLIAPKHGIFDARMNEVAGLEYEVYDEATGAMRPVTMGDELNYRMGQIESMKWMADQYRSDPASLLPDELMYLQGAAARWEVEVEDLADMSQEFMAQVIGRRVTKDWHDYIVKANNVKLPKQMEDRDLMSLPRNSAQARTWLVDALAEYAEYSKHMALYSNYKGLAFSMLQMTGNAASLGMTNHFGGLNEYFNPSNVKITWQNLGDDKLWDKVERMSDANRIRRASGLGPSKRMSAHHVENPSASNWFGKHAQLAKTAKGKKAWGVAEKVMAHPAWQRLGQVWDTQLRDSVWLDYFSRRSRVSSFHMQTQAKRKLNDAFAAGHHGLGITEADIDQAFENLRGRNGGFFDGRALGIELLRVSGATDNKALNFAKRIGKDWHQTMRGLDDLAQDEVERVAFSFRARNIDEKIGNIVFFHYWGSRAMALYGSTLLKNPWMMNAFFNMWEEMEYEADRSGRRDNFFGYFGLARSVGAGLWNSRFGYLAMFNLPQSLGPVSQVMDMFQEGDNYAADRTAIGNALENYNPFMMHPLVELLLAGAGVLGKDPNIADISSLKGLEGGVVDVLNAALLAPAGRAYTGGMPTDVAQSRAVWFLSNGIDQLTQGLPILNMLEGTRDADLGAGNVNEITWEMHSILAAQHPTASKLELNQMLQAELLRGTDSPVWRDATNNWAKKNLAESVWNFAVPARTKLVEQEKADYQKGNAEGTNTSHEYFTADAASRADAEDLIFDYDNYIWKEGLGTETSRSLNSMKNGIYYGDLPDGVTVNIRGQDYTSDDLQALPEQLRSDLAEEYLDEHGGTDARMALYDLDLERLQYLQDHPLVATYGQWSDALTESTAGLEQSVEWLRSQNPGYAEYLRTVELNVEPGTEDWKRQAIDKQGFQAAMGMEWNAYTDTLEVDGHPVSRESMEDLTQSGQEAAEERYGHELTDKQREMASDLPENADRALAIMASLDALDPSGYAKQLWIDKAHGLRKDERLPYDIYSSLKAQYGDTFVPRSAVDYALWDGRTSDDSERTLSRFLYESNQDYWDSQREARFEMRAQGMDEETIASIQELQRAAESLSPPSSSGKSWSDAGTYDSSKEGSGDDYATESWSGSSRYGTYGSKWSRDYRSNQWDRGEYVSPTDFLNLRMGPGLNHESRMVLHAGEDLFVLGEDFMDGERWVRVRTPSGQVGWVMSKFLGRGKKQRRPGLGDLGDRIERTVTGRVAARRR